VFDSGASGMAYDLGRTGIGIVLLSGAEQVRAGEGVSGVYCLPSRGSPCAGCTSTATASTQLRLGKDIALLLDHDQGRTLGLGKVIIPLLQVQPKRQPPRMPKGSEMLRRHPKRCDSRDHPLCLETGGDLSRPAAGQRGYQEEQCHRHALSSHRIPSRSSPVTDPVIDASSCCQSMGHSIPAVASRWL
jgi:hypothetical protein